MDRKGNSSIILVILVPIFLVIAAVLVDNGINMYNDKKLEDITESVIISLLDYEDLSKVDYSNRDDVMAKLEERAKLIYQNNEIDTEYLRVEILYGEKIQVSNSHVYYSFMNSLFNKGNGNRQTIVEAVGYKDDKGEVVVEFMGDTNEN